MKKHGYPQSSSMPKIMVGHIHLFVNENDSFGADMDRLIDELNEVLVA